MWVHPSNGEIGGRDGQATIWGRYPPTEVAYQECHAAHRVRHSICAARRQLSASPALVLAGKPDCGLRQTLVFLVILFFIVTGIQLGGGGRMRAAATVQRLSTSSLSMSICKDCASTWNQHSIDNTTQQADYQLYDTSFYLKPVVKLSPETSKGWTFFWY
jgi:hypothetical protein